MIDSEQPTALLVLDDNDLADKDLMAPSSIWVIFLNHSSVDDSDEPDEEQRKSAMTREKISNSESNSHSQNHSLDAKKPLFLIKKLSVMPVMAPVQNMDQNQKNV
jgi:hypothetical protein